jgi:hypothetical protein
MGHVYMRGRQSRVSNSNDGVAAMIFLLLRYEILMGRMVWEDGRVKEWKDGQMDRWTDGRMEGYVAGTMNS